MLKTDFPERFQDLAVASIHSVRLADEGDDHIPAGGFVEERFGVARRDYLAAVSRRRIRYHLVYLALAQDFKMGVRLVQQKRRAGVGVEIGEYQQRLLEAPAAGRQVKNRAALAVCHCYLAALGYVARLVKARAEQAVYALNDFAPAVGVFFLYAVAEIPQNFGGSALADADVHRANVQPRLCRRQAGHGGKKGDLSIRRPFWDGHPFRIAPFPDAQRTAVDGFRVGVVELHSASPLAAFGNALYNHVYSDVLGSRLAVHSAHIA